MKCKNFDKAKELVAKIKEIEEMVDVIKNTHDVYLDADGYSSWYAPEIFDQQKEAFLGMLTIAASEKIQVLIDELSQF